jgi:type VI secretion system protein ImpC
MRDEEPFRVVLLGDFSGRSERAPIASRKPVMIDRDNFDAVLAKLDVGVEVSAGRISIGDIDHFGPDHIYATYPPFREMRSTRDRLGDPETFAEAARDLLGATPTPMPAGGAASLLDQILGETGAAAKPARRLDDLQKFVQEAVRPYLVEREDPRAPELIRQVDEASTGLMRVILHHPKFQALEAAWRAVFLMIRRLDTGTDLKVYLLDVTKEELAQDPDEVYEILTQRSGPWAVIAGNYAFGAGDCPLLGVLGLIARKAGAPFIAEADLSMLGSEQFAAFRRTPEAAQVGLALPRILLRLPYGERTIPCEIFDFEEVAGKPEAKEMLYANPSFFCAMLLSEAFERHGWNLKPGVIRDITGLPVYVYEEDGDKVGFPCTEVALTQDQAEALIEAGFMPVAAYRDRDLARVLMFQSAAEPPTALKGRWSK